VANQYDGKSSDELAAASKVYSLVYDMIHDELDTHNWINTWQPSEEEVTLMVSVFVDLARSSLRFSESVTDELKRRGDY
jgi:hypothetical protein